MSDTNAQAVVKFEKELADKLFPDNDEFIKEDLVDLGGKGKTLKTKTIEKINEIMGADLVTLQNYRENFIGFSSVLKEGTYGVEAYADAVRYVTYKISGLSNQASYMRTFPERYKRLLDKNMDEQQISSFVSAYNKGKLVTALYEQSVIPAYISNADVFQAAINHQMKLMTEAKSEKVQSDAANSLLTHLKAPEKSKIELDVSIKQDASVIEMRESLRRLAETQRELIESGSVSAAAIAASKISERVIEHDSSS